MAAPLSLSLSLSEMSIRTRFNENVSDVSRRPPTECTAGYEFSLR